MAEDASGVSDGVSEGLGGGLANAGRVMRRGVAVRRPAPPTAPAVHAYLRALREVGFAGAPEPRRLSAEGWEELEYLHGDVAVPPYPWWSMTDAALASVGRLQRAYHDAAADVGYDGTVQWPSALADPEGGPILCHNDFCLENVVFRDGTATGVIDFDFAAPGRAVWDLAMTARYWVPVLDPTSAAVSGRDHLDPARRLRVLVDAYGLDDEARASFVDVLLLTVEVARGFVADRVAAGDAPFVRSLASHGGWARWDRIQAWLHDQRGAFETAVGRP